MTGLKFASTDNNGLFYVPDVVVDQYINGAPERATDILLYILRHAGGFEIADICGALGIENATLLAAVNYWCACEVLKSENGEISFDFACVSVRKNADKKVESVSVPEYVFAEISTVIDKNQQLKSLLNAVQTKFSRPLTPNAVKTLYSFYDFYGFSTQIIFMLVSFCCESGKGNMKYIEQVAHTWYSDGINNEHLAAEYIKAAKIRHSRESTVRRLFGIGERKLSTKEKNCIKRWGDVYAYDEEMLKNAYERCIDATGKLSFAYIDKILTNWFENGFKKPEDIVDKKPEKPAKGKTKGKTGTSTFDTKEFEEWAYQNFYDDKGGEK